MGIAIALSFSLLLCLVAMVTRPIIVLYALLFIFVFFEEIGSGFTSFTGSIFFNQGFLKFYNFKFIEIVIISTYTYVLLMCRNRRAQVLRTEKWLFFIFLGLVTFLCFIEFFKHNTITAFGWRYMLSGES